MTGTSQPCPRLTAPGAVAVPVTVTVDEEHGGRWTSLRAGSREWLWRHPDDALQRARAMATPGQRFVDAGGVEECFPTVRGTPDHGDVWSRSWQGGVAVTESGLTLRRSLAADGPDLLVRYLVTGPCDVPFVHAVHALLDLGPDAVLHVDDVPAVLVLDQPVPGEVSVVRWPDGTGTDLRRLGPDDGTAVCGLLPGCTHADIVDAGAGLCLTWTTDDPRDAHLASLLLWRNLRGWPTAAPYRSIGIEPMIGQAADVGSAEPGERARTRGVGAPAVGGPGTLGWSLRISAWRQFCG